MDRITKLLTQKIYLIFVKKCTNRSYIFNLLGHPVRNKPAIIHTVKISSHIGCECTCLDFRIRHILCKHILFLLVRVGRLTEYTNQEIYMSKTPEEMCAEFAIIIPRILDRINKHKYEKEPSIPNETDIDIGILVKDECSICFDDFINKKQAIFKCIECKNTFHQSCINIWKRYDVNCPLCITPIV